MQRIACVLSYIFFFRFCIKSDIWYPVYLIDGIKLDSFGDDLHIILLYYLQVCSSHHVLPRRTETNN